MPVKYMRTTATITDNGIEHAITIVGFKSLNSVSTVVVQNQINFGHVQIVETKIKILHYTVKAAEKQNS